MTELRSEISRKGMKRIACSRRVKPMEKKKEERRIQLQVFVRYKPHQFNESVWLTLQVEKHMQWLIVEKWKSALILGQGA